MSAVKIRAAQPADAPDIAAYHRRCFESTYAGHIARGELQIPDIDLVRAQFERWFVPGSEFVTRVADVDGRPVAHVTVSANLLVHLFVDPSRQGTGLGRRLLALGESILAEAGHSAFELHARVENVAAIGFYQSAGWAMTGHRLQTEEHGITYEEHVLVKGA